MPVVTVRPGAVEVTLDDGETILDGLYRNGYAYRIGCRRGGCGVCKVDLLVGEVRYDRTVAPEVLTAGERASGTCLTCRAVPVTDVTIALRDQDLRRVSSLLAFYAHHT